MNRGVVGLRTRRRGQSGQRGFRVCGEDFSGIGEEQGFGGKDIIMDRNPNFDFTA